MLEQILIYISIGWFIVEFEPFQLLVNWTKSKITNDYLEYLIGVFDCWQCSTFWSAWIISGSFKIAVVSSFVTFIIDMLWNSKR